LKSTLTVQLDLSETDSDQMSGLVTDGSWSAPLVANRAVFDGKTNPAPQAGTYTLLIPGTPGLTETPAGDGYGTVKVGPLGHVLLNGALADGTKVTKSATISKAGEWPLYVSLYNGQGSILGWLLFTNLTGEDLGGSLGWSKGQQPSAKYYPMGFAIETEVLGSKYVPALESGILSNFGQLSLAQGDLTQSFTNQFILTSNNKVSNLSSNKLTLSFNLASGLFKGTVAEPVTRRLIPINGVVLQAQNYGGGFFLNLNQSGPVYLGQ